MIYWTRKDYKSDPMVKHNKILAIHDMGEKKVNRSQSSKATNTTHKKAKLKWSDTFFYKFKKDCTIR